MIEYVINELRNTRHERKDTAIVYDCAVSVEVVHAWHETCKTKPHSWRDNPAIALIFDLETEAEEYEAWKYFHEGKYAFVEDM